MSRLTIVSASAKAWSVASSSPASQVGRGEVVDLALLVVADQRRVGVERLARVDDRVQRLVVDVDQLQRVARDVLVGRDHGRDLLALEADLVAREHGLRVVGDRRHPRQPERLEVLRGDHRGHARERERRATCRSS